MASRGELYTAVAMKCADCMGHEEVITRIRECHAEGVCPLWHYRPYQH